MVEQEQFNSIKSFSINLRDRRIPNPESEASLSLQNQQDLDFHSKLWIKDTSKIKGNPFIQCSDIQMPTEPRSHATKILKPVDPEVLDNYPRRRLQYSISDTNSKKWEYTNEKLLEFNQSDEESQISEKKSMSQDQYMSSPVKSEIPMSMCQQWEPEQEQKVKAKDNHQEQEAAN